MAMGGSLACIWGVSLFAIRRNTPPAAVIAPYGRPSELAVVAFLEGVEEVGGAVQLAVVLDLFVALELDHAAVLELETVGGVLQVLLLDQHALEGGRVEAERGAALQALRV